MRFLITIGSPDCPKVGAGRLHEVEGDVRKVAEMLTGPDLEQGYEHVLTQELKIGPPPDALGPSSATIRDALVRWFGEVGRVPGDIAVIYATGHGDSHGNFKAHCLLTSDTEPKRGATAVALRDLVRWVFDPLNFPHSVLLILDVCWAGLGAAEAVAEVLRGLPSDFPQGAGLWVLTAADRKTMAADGEFVRAWQALMADEAYLPRGGPEFLNLLSLRDGINFHLGRNRTQTVGLFGYGLNPAEFIRNPRGGRALGVPIEVDLLADEEWFSHWVAKARGHDTPGVDVSFFTGRSAILAVCRAWLHAPASDGRARVVTGGPGSGKSAVLGQLVLNPNPTPPVRFHARGQRVGDAVSSLARQLGVTARSVPELLTELGKRTEPIGIVIDALDESAEPAVLERELLRGLAACPAVRLIVGVRRSVGRAILDGSAVTLDLDAPAYFDPADVAGYSFALLTATVGRRGTYADPVHHPAARAVAQEVARRAGTSFLYARVASRRFATAPPVDPTTAEWTNTLPPVDPAELFADELKRFGPDEGRFTDLLVPLAYARRRGLPHKNIWATVASRISGRQYSNVDIRELKERAGFYLVQDAEDGDAVFRLFHQSFADYLRWLTRDEGVEEAFARALLELVEDMGGWGTVRDPYLLWAFPSHAAAGQRLAVALADPAFLLAVPPTALRPELVKVNDPAAWPIAQAYRRAYHWLVDGDRVEAARYLQLAALQCGVTGLRDGLRAAAGAGWWPRWVRWEVPTTSGLVAVEADTYVTALCASRDMDGNLLAVCGHTDGAVSAWQVAHTARSMSVPPPGGGQVGGVAAAVCGGEPVVVAVWRDGSVRAFHQATGEQTGHWAGFAPPADNDILWPTNVVTVADGNAVLAAVGRGTELVLLELPTLTIRAHRPDATTARLITLAATQRNGQPVIASGGDTLRAGEKCEGFPVKIWDVRTLAPLVAGGADLTIARTVAATEVGGEELLVVTEWIAERYFRTTDLAPALPSTRPDNAIFASFPSGQQTRLFRRRGEKLHITTVSSRADGEGRSLSAADEDRDVDVTDELWSGVADLEGRPVLLSAAGVRVRVWDVQELLARPAAGSPPQLPTSALSACTANGVVYTGDRTGRVTAWSGAGVPLWSRAVTRDAVRSLAVADGELLVGTQGGVVHRLVAATGQVGPPDIRAGKDLMSMVVHPLGGRDHLFAAVEVAAGGNEVYCVRVWDLSMDNELPTWAPTEGPAAGSAPGGPAYNPALTMSGYYRTKVLYGVAAVDWGGTTLVGLAGPGGEIRVMDVQTMKQVVEKAGGSSSDYVHSLAGAVIEGEPWFFGGDEKGRLFGIGLAPGAAGMRRNETAHRRFIHSLALRQTPNGWVLASGWADGWVRFWTPDLRLLLEIDFERRVTTVAWLDDDLIVATDRGIVCVEFDWTAVFTPR
jgi:WD40 repeat protein